MLDELFPRYHRRYAASQFGSQLELFAKWLASKGYGHIPAHNHVRRLKQVLEASSAPFPATLERGDLERLFAAHADATLFRATRALRPSRPRTTAPTLTCGTWTRTNAA